MGSVLNVEVKDSSTLLRMTERIANVNIYVTLNEVEGSFCICTPTFAKKPFYAGSVLNVDVKRFFDAKMAERMLNPIITLYNSPKRPTQAFAYPQQHSAEK